MVGNGTVPENSHPNFPCNTSFMGTVGILWKAQRGETDAALDTSREKKPHNGAGSELWSL